MTAGFVNLHNHSEYSLLDGYAHITEYIRHAHEMGQSAVAITDHGNLYGIHEFITACRDLSKTFNHKGKPQDPIYVKPIPGIEAYMAPLNPLGARVQTPVFYGRPEQHDDDVSSSGKYLHLTLLAYNSAGFHNLIRLSSESFKPENMLAKYPRMDMDMLEKWNEGLIATTGCPSGEVPTRLRLGQKREAYEYAERMRDIFDGRYFVEIMQHDMKRPLERDLLPMLVQLAEDLDLPLLATNDSHYSYPDDAKHQEELLCISTKSSMLDQTKENGGKRFAFDGNDYYLKSEEEMRRVFPDDEYPGAVDNSVRIATLVDDWWASDAALADGDGGVKQPVLAAGDAPVPSFDVDGDCVTVSRADKGWSLGVVSMIEGAAGYDGALFKGLATIRAERATNPGSLTGFPLPDNPVTMTAERVSEPVQKAIDSGSLGAGPFDLSLDSKLRPVVEIPEGYTEETWFQKKINDGFIAKRLNAGDSKEVLEESKRKIALEYPVFANNNFIQYMLVVQDYINWAKSQGIVVGAGRGSVGGSEIAYLMSISDTDPIRHDLLFERFLNPERVSPPDVDTDFQASRRDEVLEYVKRKYGDERIKNIITISREKAKNSIKDMARAYGVQPFESNIATSKLPRTAQGEELSVAAILDPSSDLYAECIDFREYTFESSDADKARRWRRVMESAAAIQGRVRGTGNHACGVIMSDEIISEHVPTAHRTVKAQDKLNPDYKESWGETVVQWGYEACESMGLIKMDFLSLANIDIIGDTIDNILRMNGARESEIAGSNRVETIKRFRDKGIEIPDMSVLNHGPMNDRATYEMLGRGESVGVFQLSSEGIRELLKRMKPQVFEDLSATIALYRPGPMAMNAHLDYADRASGVQERYVLNKELDHAFRNTAVEAVTQPTYGLILYQEEIMQISQKLSGFTKGQSDSLRKAIGHKKIEVMQQMEASFKRGAVENGVDGDAVNGLWDIIVAFASYAFNKSHSAAYALTSYDTAYLKAHYPVEFMAALISGAIGSKDKIQELVNECLNINLRVGNVDINKSGVNVTPVHRENPDDPDIVFGLACVEGITAPVAEQIIDARVRNGGKFKDFDDFMRSLPEEVINKTVIENLAKVGAFDSLNVTRRAVAVAVEEIVKYYKKERRNEDKGQFSLFAMMTTGDDSASNVTYKLPDIADWSFIEKLGMERELMGTRISANPLQNAGAGLEALRNESISSAEKLKQNSVLSTTTIHDFNEMEPGSRQYRVIGWFDAVDERRTRDGGTWLAATIADETGAADISMSRGAYEEVLAAGTKPQVDHVYMFTLRMTRSFKDDSKRASITGIREIELTADGRIPMWVHLTHSENHGDERAQAIRNLITEHAGDLPVMVDWMNPDGTRAGTEELGCIDWNADRQLDLEHIVGRNAFGQWNQ